ncbi:MAG: D-ribose pyranase [Rhodothermales bacterium]|nr:D-ribose pyranase [Rhodothermales bacterium]
MKKTGTLNVRLSAIIAGMGHLDRLVICDSGLPIPNGSQVVDLALTTNIPRFLDTLSVVLQELQVERVIVATEMLQKSESVFAEVKRLADEAPVEDVPHEEFKRLTRNGEKIAFVRTGEATPFANAILVSGVTF